MAFKRGKPTGPLKKIGAARGTGTTVYFHPDSTIFPKVEFDAAVIRERLEVISYIHKGVKVTFESEADGTKAVFHHEEGLADYLKRLFWRSAKPVLRHGVRSRARERPAARPGAAVDRSHRRAHSQLRQRHSDGIGRHARQRTARRSRQGGAELHRDAQPVAEGVTLTSEDIREGLTGVLSLFIEEPQFQVTKDRLNNPKCCQRSIQRCARHSNTG